ncbi:MAG: NAD(+)/NADH kinase [Bacillota bacterium]|jgi:NAD+ kinase
MANFFTVIVNHKKQQNILYAEKIVAYLKKRGAELLLPDNASGYNLDNCQNIDFSGISAAIVLGGDGTILAASKIFSKFSIPMVGINMGNLGFLSAVEKADIYPALDKLLAGDYFSEDRMMLTGKVKKTDGGEIELLALNELVVNNSFYTRTIALDLLINDNKIRSCNSDGIIVATPTGSTAYSFSAGGPLVDPALKVILVNFICPHSFLNRPMVVADNSIVKITLSGVDLEGAKLTADGQASYVLKKGDAITIQKALYTSKLIRFAPVNFFNRVSDKLNKQ